MDTFRLVVFNTPGENPCHFQNATQTTLDLREGQWWVPLASVLRNFRPCEKDSETIFIHCNLIEPIPFGGHTQSVLRSVDDDTPMIADSRKELHYTITFTLSLSTLMDVQDTQHLRGSTA